MAEIRMALERRGNDALLWIPLALLDFLCIHPFTDGNGRVGRLQTLLLLGRSAWILGRYISLERLVEEARAGYYESLEASSQGWYGSGMIHCSGAATCGAYCCAATGSSSSASIPWPSGARARLWWCHGLGSANWCARPACANWTVAGQRAGFL